MTRIERRSKAVMRLLLGGAALIVLLVVAAAVALRLYFSPERLNRLAVAYAESVTGRQVSLGEVRVGLFNGITLTDVRVSACPSFDAGTAATARRIVAEPELLPLFRRRLSIRRLLMEGPRVRVKAGSFECGPEKDRDGKPPVSGAETAAAVLLSVESLRVSDGTVMFEEGPRPTVSGITLTAQDISPEGPFVVTGEGTLTVRDLSLSVNGAVTASPIAGRLEIARLMLSGAPGSLEVRGTLRGVTVPGAADVRVRGERALLERVAGYWPVLQRVRVGTDERVDFEVVHDGGDTRIRFNRR